MNPIRPIDREVAAAMWLELTSSDGNKNGITEREIAQMVANAYTISDEKIEECIFELSRFFAGDKFDSVLLTKTQREVLIGILKSHFQNFNSGVDATTRTPFPTLNYKTIRG